MTDAPAPAAPRPPDNGQAGALLRAARQQQGLHIAALAASIKVTPAKLEALESGRYHELPDATFTRALALTICRVLKIDPAPVLAQLPGAPSGSLHRVDGGLNTPFREHAGRVDPADWAPWRRPLLWLAGALLVAAAAFVLVPSVPNGLGTLPGMDAAVPPVMPPSEAAVGLPAADNGQGAPSADPAAPAATPVPAASAAAPLLPGAAASAATSSLSAAGSTGASLSNASLTTAGPAAVALPQPASDALVLRAIQATWVQATDANGQVLMARLVPAGETVELTPALPVRLRIGNAQGTELQFRGQPVNLGNTRDNIANITLP